MRLAHTLAFAFLFFSCATSASSVDEREFNFTVSQAPGLISVSSDINTTNLLPGFQYNYTLTVSWAVPPESLNSINAREVILYIQAIPDNNSPQFYFVQDGRNESEFYCRLKCVISDGECGNGSILSRRIPVYFMLDSASNITSERMVVRGSVTPFASDAEILETSALIENLTQANLGDSLAQRLEDAKGRAEQGDYGKALTELRAVLSEFTLASQPTPAPAAGGDNWGLLISVVAVLFVILLAALLFSRRKESKRGRGIDHLEDEEIRGRDYREEKPSPPQEVEYNPPEKKEEGGEPPIVTRVPDWM